MDRRLTTILAADVVGYSRLMGADEAGTLAELKTHRTDLIDPKAAQHGGRTIKLMGDGILMEFGSVVDAVFFAVDVQHAMQSRNEGVPEGRQIRYRVGINIGDVIVEDEDIYGDGVNVAARLEGLADAGGICIGRSVRDQIRDKLDLNLQDLGDVEVKNIVRPVRAFQIVMDGKVSALSTPVVRSSARSMGKSRSAGIAVATGLLIIVFGGVMLWWKPWSPEIEPAR
ncbi:MAG: adenylate/guanylate cyclase domain-containing protein, partial [Hyphomicrobiales bacterium]|nr:adenylate/guanylate cyclase domain-containing protein [Hyphomicrobiales bacterium]